ncbi:MAG: 8-oxoguanine deaminase [Thermoleophilaceae bacterium]|jgi:cytosine/adenosine deaminase-related metal-dependent hydrolase|nr:8-oxoguanine deaminase [Thermoleophilaceae bacterium]
MTSLLVENIDVLVTMDEDRRVLENAWVLTEDGAVIRVGLHADGAPTEASRKIDARGHIVMPGLVNTHHHFFQTLLRAVPSLQNAALWEWLQELYLPMGTLTDEMVHASTRTALAELMLSGCTTAQDHSYLCVNDVAFETEIEAAREMGVRFHLSRGSMTLGTSEGSIPSDDITENEEDVLTSCEQLVKSFHDASPLAMTRIELAPCSLFSVSPRLMRESADLARTLGVGLHTHCYESQEEEDFCFEHYGKRPVAWAADLGWEGPDTWFAHAVRHIEEDIAQMAKAGTGVAHCPSSNMRLASGIPPVRDFLDSGIRVGLGVDGSASNDGSHLLGEARMAMLLQRIRYGAGGMSATEALEIATLGGAAVLGRDDIGSLAPGKAADLIGFDLNTLDFAGAQHDPVAALVFCTPARVRFSVIAGQVVVDDGELVGVDMATLVADQNRLADEMVKRTEKRYGNDMSTRVWKRALAPSA